VDHCQRHHEAEEVLEHGGVVDAHLEGCKGGFAGILRSVEIASIGE